MRRSVLVTSIALLLLVTWMARSRITAGPVEMVLDSAGLDAAGFRRAFKDEGNAAVLGTKSSAVPGMDPTMETEESPGFSLPGTSTAALPFDAMLIRVGNASIEVRALQPAIDEVRALAGHVGGYVANTSIQAGDERLRSASIELRIPNDRFDAAVSGINGLGKLETVQVSTEDVGEQYTDIAARVENAHRLEDRLVDVLSNRPGKLADILQVERELARVREEIERYEGRLRYLKSRAETSRLTLSLHEPVPVLEQTGQSPLVDAVRQAWGRFLGLVTLAISWSGIVIPVGLIAGGAWWTLRRRRRSLPVPA